VLKDLAATPIRNLRSPNAMTVTPEIPVGETIRRMVERRCGAVIVVDAEGRLAGIFTERDVLLRGLEGKPFWQERPVGEVMTVTPMSLRDDDTLEVALGFMKRGHFRHLPVVDGDRPVGVLSVRDVLAHVAQQFPKQFVNLPPEPPRESGRVWSG
jgi:CBS domain-containing protein